MSWDIGDQSQMPWSLNLNLDKTNILGLLYTIILDLLVSIALLTSPDFDYAFAQSDRKCRGHDDAIEVFKRRCDLKSNVEQPAILVSGLI